MNANLFFHGTSYENYKAIMENGFADSKPLVWDCADEEVTYLYQFDKLVEAEQYENEDFANQLYFCLSRTNESAQVTASIQDSKADKTVVFEIMVPENIIEEFMSHISLDESCPNMAEIGAVTIDSNKLNYYWKNGLIKVTPHFFDYYPRLSLFYISGLYTNDYLNNARWDMDKATLEAWKLLNENNIFLEELIYAEETYDD